MGFVEYLKQGFEIFKLNEREVDSASKDEGSLKFGLLFVVIGSVLSWIGASFLLGFSAGRLIAGLVFSLVGLFVVVALVHITAKVLGGKGSYMELIRPSSLLSFVSWPSIIPVIGSIVSGLAGLWTLVVTVVIVKKVYSLSTGKSILALVIPIVVIWILIAVVFATLLATLGLASLIPKLGPVNY